MQEKTVSDLLDPNVVVVAGDTPITQVASKMASIKASCAMVVDGKRPVGIVSQTDLCKLVALSADNPMVLRQTAADLMTRELSLITEHQSLEDQRFLEQAIQHRHLPVVNSSGELLGIVDHKNAATQYYGFLGARSELLESAIQARTSSLQQVNDELRTMSLEDPLMGIGNRRAMELELTHTHAGSIRYSRHYCVALADVDHFKKYNDEYGHAAGDEVLRAVALALKQCIRGTDRIYRYGGEELLILLPDTDTQGALTFMKRALGEITSKGIPHAGSPYGIVTISAGIAGVFAEGKCRPSWQDVLEHADRALYQSKNADRNTASIAA